MTHWRSRGDARGPAPLDYRPASRYPNVLSGYLPTFAAGLAWGAALALAVLLLAWQAGL